MQGCCARLLRVCVVQALCWRCAGEFSGDFSSVLLALRGRLRGIPLLENKKVWGFPYLKIEMLPNFHSMFLIDVKFISKLLEMFSWEFYHFPILISTKLLTNTNTQYLYIKVFPTKQFPKILFRTLVGIPFKNRKFSNF